MKEKFKNFLLKTKKFFSQKYSFTFIQLIVIAILINFITMFLSFVEIKAFDLCFNETHTEEIVESPQADTLRIERDINRYGYNYGGDITFVGTPIIVDSPFSNFYFNTILPVGYVEDRVSSLTDYMLYFEDEDIYLYPLFTLINASESFFLTCNLIYSYFPAGVVGDSPMKYCAIYFEDSDNSSYPIYATLGSLDGLDGLNGFAIGTETITLGAVYQIIRNQNLDYVIEAGIYNDHFSWLVSRTPYTIESSGGANYQDGYNAGYDDGYDDGNVDGFFDGEEYGYNNGYTNGVNDGFENGFLEGEEYGYYNGYGVGYTDGKNAGVSITNPLNPIMDFIADGASVISNVFSFEILPNISLGTMLLFPLAIALIWFVIKLFMGG